MVLLTMAVIKGDIHLVDLNPSKGKEMGKYRPSVIVSKTIDNDILDTIIIIPLSSQLLDNAYPYKVRLNKRDLLKLDSEACINEVRALSKKRVKEKLASTTPKEMQTITEALTEIINH